MLRKTTMFRWAGNATEAAKQSAREGLAFLARSPHTVALDFGVDFNIRIPQNYDFVLLHDHSSMDDLIIFDRDPDHVRARETLNAITVAEDTAQIVWEYDGPPSQKGMVRHSAMFYWADETTAEQKTAVKEALEEQIRVSKSIRGFGYGDRLTAEGTGYDWILEGQFDDVEGLMAYFNHPFHKELSDFNHDVTKDPISARVQSHILIN